ncbi:MAG: hypothetical protein AAI978_00265 [Candidatus Hodgkinia cicadicola]
MCNSAICVISNSIDNTSWCAKFLFLLLSNIMLINIVITVLYNETLSTELDSTGGHLPPVMLYNMLCSLSLLT